MGTYRYLFGPVASRRYGQSLGIDLAVPKTCSLNCLFCQLGPTPHTTLERFDTPAIGDVLAELRQWLASGNTADFVTACGSGEPTLHRSFGELLRFVRSETPCRSLLLSNGSLFYLPKVRRDASFADVVKVSLHAWDQASFERIVRPHPDLRFGAIIDGYRAFRKEFGGRLDLEVFIVPGINDAPEQARRIADLAQSFAPDTISLNTALRPPADQSVHACTPQHLEALRALFGPAAQEIGAEPPRAALALSEATLVALVGRHPVSLRSLAATFQTTENDLRAFLAPLLAAHSVSLVETENTLFVCAPQPEPPDVR